jgi:hypothetical protein
MSDTSSDFFSTAIAKPSINFGRPPVFGEAGILSTEKIYPHYSM